MTSLVGPNGAPLEDTDGPTRRFAELLHQYDSALSLEYVPDISVATVDEILKPFRIVKNTPKVGREVLRYVSAEEIKRPDRLLNWIWEGDLSKHKPGEIWDRMEGEKRARKMLDLKRQEDEAAERIDKTAFMVSGGRDKKNRVQLGRNHYVGTMA